MVLRKTFAELVVFAFIVIYSWRAVAGLQIVTTDVMQSGPMSSTNLVIAKIQTNAMRMDIGSASSVITLPAASGQIQLFHQNKTYQWLTTKEVVPDTNPPPPLPAALETTFDGHAARLFCFTNGPEQSHVWVAPSSQFFKSPASGFSSVSQPPDLSKWPRPGFPLDTKSIIVGTEHTTIAPVVMPMVPGAEVSEPQLTNLVIVQTSKLISITETNFAASDFELPKDYIPGNGLPQPTNQFSPDQLGHGPTGQGNLEVLRKGYEQGKPVLSWPPGMMNPK
jgi:hypothetical protein